MAVGASASTRPATRENDSPGRRLPGPELGAEYRPRALSPSARRHVLRRRSSVRGDRPVSLGELRTSRRTRRCLGGREQPAHGRRWNQAPCLRPGREQNLRRFLPRLSGRWQWTGTRTQSLCGLRLRLLPAPNSCCLSLGLVRHSRCGRVAGTVARAAGGDWRGACVAIQPTTSSAWSSTSLTPRPRARFGSPELPSGRAAAGGIASIATSPEKNRRRKLPN